MNQKYLMGMAAEGGQAVVFEAKASNVAAFARTEQRRNY